jgi:predicted Rossmann fold flavoprotein
MSDPLPFVIVGAGGSGLLAAAIAAARGARVIVLERNRKAGVKLRISGGGKCNVTHDGTPEVVLSAFPPRQRRFLKPSLYLYPADEVRGFLSREGVPTIVRQDGRVFPQSGRADDVVRAFERSLDRHGAVLRLNERVETVRISDGKVSGVVVNGVFLGARAVLVATGGGSYRKTGTTGDGFIWAHEAGHSIIPLRPALAPIAVHPTLPASWRGIALRDGVLSLYADSTRIHHAAGDLLFTHEGVSGPAALDCSNAGSQCPGGRLVWDFLPGRDYQETDRMLRERIAKNRGKMIQSQLFDLLPNRLVPDLLRAAGVPPEARGHTFPAGQRRAVVRLLKEWTIGRVAGVDIDRGEVTAGGIALDEVDPRTMESRLVQGLYFAGEVLDIDGPIGGYNLQAAFSTGVAAARHVTHSGNGA